MKYKLPQFKFKMSSTKYMNLSGAKIPESMLKKSRLTVDFKTILF